MKAPFEALLADLDDELGPFRMFRPYRDVRFSKDKSPYKLAAAASTRGRAGHRPLRAALGRRACTSGRATTTWRRTSSAGSGRRSTTTTAGEAIVAVCAELEKAGHEIAAFEELKTAPRGYPKDHPRIAFLRRKGLVAMRSFPVAGWMHTAKAEARVVEVWRQQQPMNDWLDSHVGPSELPPDDREW